MIYTFELDDFNLYQITPITYNFLNSIEYNSWINDININWYSSLCKFAVSKEDREQLLVDMKNKKAIHWSISKIKEKEEEYIGSVSLQEIDLLNRSAELAIKIGKAESHNKGVGTKACELVIYHGFTRLNLHRIHLGTINPAMINVTKKLHMLSEGKLTDAVCLNNNFVDVYLYYITKEMYEGMK